MITPSAYREPFNLLGALSPGQQQVVARLAETFTSSGESIYLVGGIVRDALLGRSLPNDLDLTTSATPERSHELGLAAGATSAYLIGERFGTVGFVFANADQDEASQPIQVEITTYRQESYPDDTRFPTVAFSTTVDDDLSRRDFTINAIAADPRTGELVDPFLGQADLAQATIRAVGDPDDRFTEDPLRLLRAARFIAQLGFRLDRETEAAMARQATSLVRISRERVFAEMSKLLVGEYAADGLGVLASTGLLAIALPQLADLEAEAAIDPGSRRFREKELWPHTLSVVSQTPARPVVRWAALLHDAAKPRTRRVDHRGEISFLGHERAGAELASSMLKQLHADKATTSGVARIVELHGRPSTYDESWTDTAVRRLALDAGPVWEDLLDLAAADVTSGRADRRQRATQRIEQLRRHHDRLLAEASLDELQSPLDGNELMIMFDRGPGIWIRDVKDQLRELVIDGVLEPGDRVSAERIARQLLADLDATTT